MRLLVFADLHGRMDYLENLKKISRNVDLILCAGDISSMEKNLSLLMMELDSIGKPILMIHGNHEDEDGLKELCNDHPNIIWLHKAVHRIGDYVFLGYGGGGFNTQDPEFEHVADRFFRNEILGSKRIILMTHQPPSGTEIDNLGGDHRGSKSIRKFVDYAEPHLVISGHLHETAGKQDKIGRTLFINPGPKGIIIDI